MVPTRDLGIIETLHERLFFVFHFSFHVYFVPVNEHKCGDGHFDHPGSGNESIDDYGNQPGLGDERCGNEIGSNGSGFALVQCAFALARIGLDQD